MTDNSRRKPYEPGPGWPTEDYTEYAARLRADLAALKSEQASPTTPERGVIVARWIELIEHELRKLGEKPE